MPLNIPCFEQCVAVCESLALGTGPLWPFIATACIAGCAVACDSDTLYAGGGGGGQWLAYEPAYTDPGTDPNDGSSYIG